MTAPDYSVLHFSVFDVETTIRNRGEDAIGKMSASPHHPDNSVVWYGHTMPISIASMGVENITPKCYNIAGYFSVTIAQTKLLVGHNIKFDLLYLMQDSFTRSLITTFLKKGGKIWDTMIVEYLLTGQDEQFISLDKLSLRYGGTIKDSRVKQYWEAGIDTVDIPSQEIVPYLVGDLLNTGLCFIKQYEKIQSLNPRQREAFTNLVHVQMEALLATTMMEFNGMHFDVPSAVDVAASLSAQHELLTEKLQNQMCTLINDNVRDAPLMIPEDCNPASNQQLSAVLAGGKVKHKKKVHVCDGLEPMYIKSGPNKGQPKMKNEKFEIEVTGLMQNQPHHLESTTQGYRMDENSLKKLLAQAKLMGHTVAVKLIEDILRHRSLQKELKTSYMGLLELVWPHDSCVHGNLNHCSTHTGRLSSSAPNQQNFSSKEVKE